MFISLLREHRKTETARAELQFMGFRFLATVISKHIAGLVGSEGHDFTKDEDTKNLPDEFGPGMPLDATKEWFKGLAAQCEARKNIGKGDQHLDPKP